MKKVISSIKNDRQLLAQVAFVFAAFLIMALLGSIFGSAIIDRNVEAYGREVLNTASETIEAYLDEYNIMLADVAFSLVRLSRQGYGAAEMQADVEAWTERVRARSKRYEEFSGFYGVVEGQFIDGSGWDPMTPGSEDYDPGYDPQSRPWYTGALEKEGDVCFTDPYIDADTGEFVLTASRTLIGTDGQRLGVVAMDFFLDDIEDIVNRLTLQGSGYGVLLDSERRIVVTYDRDRVGAYFDDVDEAHAQIGASLDAGTGTAHHHVVSHGEQYVVFFKQLPSGWYVGVTSQREIYYSDSVRMTVILCVAGLLMALPLSGILVYLHIKNARADETNELKNSFLAKMSHEMRTPMNAIVGMSELLKHEPLDKQQKSYVEQINVSANSLLALIDELLDIAKIEAETNGAEGDAAEGDNAEGNGAESDAAPCEKAFVAPDARILVVDDTEVNLKVASGLLAKLFKAEVDTAPSGAEAVKMVKSKDYDVIFMDHMMPGMDGLQTAAEIRKLGGKHKNRKFIALTANAIAGVKELFESHGFDGFLLKPIDTKQLGAALRKALPASKVIEVETQTSQGNALTSQNDQALQGNALASQGNALTSQNAGGTFSTALAKVKAINPQIALSRVSGMEDMLRETVELFFDKLPSEREYLADALKKGAIASRSDALAGFAIRVHGLKSSLSAIGTMPLSEAAFELEKAAKAQDGVFCTDKLPAFLDELRTLNLQLAELFGDDGDDNSGGNGNSGNNSNGDNNNNNSNNNGELGKAGDGNGDLTAGDIEVLEEKLRQAIEACEDFDDALALAVLDALKGMSFGSETKTLLKSARGALKDFDYDKAAEILAETLAETQRKAKQ